MLNDLDNVLWEISEEAPSNSTAWQDHMIALLHSYEAGKPMQHPVGYPWLTGRQRFHALRKRGGLGGAFRENLAHRQFRQGHPQRQRSFLLRHVE